MQILPFFYYRHNPFGDRFVKKKPMLFLEKMQTFEKNTPFDSYLYYKN